MGLGHIVNEGLEIASHAGGALGQGSSTILSVEGAVHDFSHHNILGGIVDSGEAIMHGVSTYGDIVSGDFL